MKSLKHCHPAVFGHGKQKFVKCLIRKHDVVATPEERVRQTILKYLLTDLGWPQNRLKLEERINFVDKTFGRADIVLTDELGMPILVIECKEEAVLLGEDVKIQAILYAQVLRANEVWLTNGQDHRYFRKDASKLWNEVTHLHATEASIPALKYPQPPKTTRLLSKFNLGNLATPKLRSFAVGALQLVFANPTFYRLPWSYRGVHILEDRGISELSIGTPGGTWSSRYRLFLVATEGRVLTAGIGLNRWANGGLILCVAFLKQGRKHHALQLQWKTTSMNSQVILRSLTTGRWAVER